MLRGGRGSEHESHASEAEALLQRMQGEAHALRLRASLLLMGFSWIAGILGVGFFIPSMTEFFVHEAMYNVTHANVLYEESWSWVSIFYICMSFAGVGNLLALTPDNLRLVRVNAIFQVVGCYFCHAVLWLLWIRMILSWDSVPHIMILWFVFCFLFTFNYTLSAVLMAPAFQRGVSARVALAHVWTAERSRLIVEFLCYFTLRSMGMWQERELSYTIGWDIFFLSEVTDFDRASL